METVGPAEGTGTTITFLPDREIFEETDFSASTLAQHLRETAFLTRAFRIVLRDERPAGTTQEFHYEGGIKDFVSLHQRVEGPGAQARRLLRGRERPGQRRGRDAVEHLVRRVDLHLREQHQHGRGRLAPLRLQGGADRHAQQVRAREGPPEGEGGQPRGRGRPRGARDRDLRQAARPAVRGPDEVEAREPLGARPRRADRQPEARRVPRGEPRRGAPDHHEGRLGLPCPPGGPEGARADATQERARELVAAGQARRLLAQGRRPLRALHRRGRQRRRLRQAGPRPHLPGDPAAAREDHQQREEPHQQGALEQRDPGDDHRDRHRLRRRVHDREHPLRPDHRDDRRRRRRRPHPDADPHVHLPHDARARRARPHLHRRAAALPRQARQPGALLREGQPARGAARPRAGEGHRDHLARRRGADAHRGPLPAVHPRASRSSRRGRRSSRASSRPPRTS